MSIVLETLAGGIAHDYNKILTPVIGYTECWIKAIDGLDIEEQKRDPEHIVSARIRAQDMIGQILAFSRETEDEMRV